MRHIQNMKPEVIREKKGVRRHAGEETFSNGYMNGGISNAYKPI